MALDMKTQMRLTGMASGLDTDAVIQNLGKVHQVRINKVKQDKQMLQWKQESYRDTISKLTSFVKANLNTANPTSNFRSSAAFAKFSYLLKGSMMIGGKSVDAADLMSVTANGDLKNFSQTVQGVAQLATKDTWTGAAMGMKGIKTDKVDFEKLGISVLGIGAVGASEEHYFTISIDGMSKTIMLKRDKIIEAFDNGSQYQIKYGIGTDSPSGQGLTDIVTDYMHGVFPTTDYYSKASDGSFKLIDEDFIQDNILHGAIIPGDTDQEDRIESYLMNKGVYGAGDAEKYEFIDSFNGYVYNETTKGYDKVDQAFLAGIDASNPNRNEAIRNYFDVRMIYKENAANAANPAQAGAQALANLINEEIVNQFHTPGYRNIVQATAAGELTFYMQGSNITLSDQFPKDTLQRLGIPSGGVSTSGSVNNKKLTDLPDFDHNFFSSNGIEMMGTIRINGVSISLSNNDTIATAMAKINGSNAGVTLSYNAVTDSFTLASKSEGTANGIQDITGNTADFFHAFGIGTVNAQGKLIDGAGTADGVRTAAQNFIGVINGEEFTRQSNTFTYEGMTYTFNKTFNVNYEMEADGNGNMVPKLDPDGNKIIERNNGKIVTGSEDPIKIEVTKNTADIVANIKNFIDEYNAIVTHLNDLLNGKRNRDYPPLTDDERKAMKDEEIKLYEDKAKSGIMANDTALRKILSDMRSAIYQKVEGVGITMADIGITTTANYKDGGVLAINEDKLKVALESRFDEVVTLFTKSSSIPSTEKDSAKVAQRYNEVGIAQRLNDIITSSAGTSLTGDKGFLVKQAGTVNDRTQFDNPMTRQLEEYDKKIDALLERWYRQENNYYAMFARMETAMSKLQAQQNSLAQIMAQAGGGK